MLHFHKFRRDLNLQQYTELWIAHIHSGINEYLTSSRGSYCKNESIVIVISGNWEYETGLFIEWYLVNAKLQEINSTKYHNAENDILKNSITSSVPSPRPFSREFAPRKRCPGVQSVSLMCATTCILQCWIFAGNKSFIERNRWFLLIINLRYILKRLVILLAGFQSNYLYYY